MATGIVAALNGNGTVTYTPSTNAKLNITISNGVSSPSGVQINGTNITVPASSTIQITPFWLGAGKTLTIYNGSGNIQTIVSALES